MKRLRREVGGASWQRRAAGLGWLTVLALLAFGMTLGVYVAGVRMQRERAGHPIPAATAR